MGRDVNGRFSSVKSFFRRVWFLTKVGVTSFAVLALAVFSGYALRGNEVSAQVIHMSTSTTTMIQQTDEVLHAIGDCESGNGTKDSRRQFLPNGKIVTHTNTDGSVDVGMYEINMSAPHIIQMAKMHIDPMTEEGNYAEAKYIHDTEGVKPWSSSQHCWINHI